MSNDCNHKNPLKRSGVNQYQRVLEALLPDFVKVDERDDADLILFAKNYASHLKYTKNDNSFDGDWKSFMSMDIAVTLASLIKLDIEELYTYSKDLLDQLKAIDSSEETDLKNFFKALYDLGFSITQILDRFYQLLPNDFAFKEVMESSIHAQLPEYFDRLKKYYQEAIVQNLLDPTSNFLPNDTPNDLIFSQDFDASTLSDIWVDMDIPVFSPTFNGGTTAIKIKNTSTHNLFTGIFDQYLKTLSGLIDAASDYLDQTLTDFPTHTPHYALYLAFIKLFRYSIDHQNELTSRHLNLYYTEILKLSKKDAAADHVHLTFELAKTAADSYLVEKDTAFKAGKDIDGKEIFYALKEDVVLGKAELSALKNVFVVKNINNGTRQVLASPIANSEDGLGAELTSADKRWKPFGDKNRTAGEVGFAVASSFLYLREGTRKITFSFFAPVGDPITFSVNHVKNQFLLKLSGEQGWIDVPIISTNVNINNTKEFFSINVTLDGGENAVIPYSQEIHGYSFAHQMPMAIFLLKDGLAKETLWDFEFEKVGIDVMVSGMKDFIIENDSGVLNPAKPFDLFGSSPKVGSSFLLGSKELFVKTLQPAGNVGVKLKLTWDNYSELISKLIAADNKHKVDIEYLEDAVWKSTKNDETLFDSTTINIQLGQAQAIQSEAPFQAQFQIQSFPQSGPENLEILPNSPIGSSIGSVQAIPFFLQTSEINFDLPQIDVDQDYSDNENFSTRSKWGFFKLKLDTPDFGHAAYPKDLADAAKAAVISTAVDASGNSTTTVDIEDVPEPYTPKVKEVSLEYSASSEVNFSNSEEGKLVHISPYGHKDISDVDAPISLLPDYGNEGELYIGVDKHVSGQTLSVLFQVAEGTADPLVEKQDVQWYYLNKTDDWAPFKKENIVDGTNGLIKSGIITFSVLKEAGETNTLMGEQVHWLKAIMAEKTQAACKLINIKAQAAVAQYFDYKNESNYFKNILPAGTISKLVVSESAIKKIEQPYSSFGGKIKEIDDHFYRRVSERLRHKDRAISMWDYERIVLEEFPEIYKVKCINHTQVVEKLSGTEVIYIDNELKPGHVLVVPIPDLHGKNAFDPLRPYTSLGILQDIRKYLYEKVSPHVNLEVRNPRFEEIQLEFNIQYLTDDEEFYTQQLKLELEQFLAPWAFDIHSDIEFGGKISKSSLINFIEERSYVDFLSCVKMYSIVDGVKSNDLEEAFATSSRSVFVSVKADDLINSHIINKTVCEC